MKIKEILSDRIVFDNGNYLLCDGFDTCCMENYADFGYLKDEPGIMDYEFDTRLEMRAVPNAGFSFGSGMRDFFVPCYSVQCSGGYTTRVTIKYYDKDDTRLDSFDVDAELKTYGSQLVGSLIEASRRYAASLTE